MILYSLVIIFAVLWIALKIIGMFITLPFRLLGAFFRRPLSTIFWVVVVLTLLSYFL